MAMTSSVFPFARPVLAIPLASVLGPAYASQQRLASTPSRLRSSRMELSSSPEQMGMYSQLLPSSESTQAQASSSESA